MSLRSRLLSRFASWALSKNPPGGYAGEDDERWAYTIVGEDGSPYLTRILLTRTPALAWLKRLTGWGVYLHKFHRPDGDQAMHDHPWKIGFSVVLCGAYVEERVDRIIDGLKWVPHDDESEVLKATKVVLTDTKLVRFFNYLTGDDFHAVRSLKGDVWTLFCTRGRFQDWGFLVDGEKVPWREYLHLNPANGQKLDDLGKEFRVPRKAWMAIDFGAPAVTPTWTHAESDSEYRERIRAAMRAQSTQQPCVGIPPRTHDQDITSHVASKGTK